MKVRAYRVSVEARNAFLKWLFTPPPKSSPVYIEKRLLKAEMLLRRIIERTDIAEYHPGLVKRVRAFLDQP